jgi:hypothetical protein
MNCKKSRKDLYLYVADELSPKAAASFEQHLAQCEDCQREIALYRQVIQSYQALPPLPDSNLRPETILNRVQQQAGAKHHVDYFPRILIPAAATVLLVFAGLIALYIVNIRKNNIHEPSAAFVSIFDEPSLFETARSTWEFPLPDIQLSKRESLNSLAQDIASLRRPVEDSLSFRSGHDSRIQYITQQITTLSTHEALHEYLDADSILRRKIL